MRVQLDNGRRKVDLEVENGIDTFLETLRKALIAMSYTEHDLIREWSLKKEEE